MARIIIPKIFEHQKKLLQNIETRHTADGAESILTPYLAEQGINLAEMLTAADTAEGFDTQHKSLMEQSEKFNDLRDKKFDPVFIRFKGSVQFLKSLFRGTISRLGDWGITVNDSAIIYPAEFTNRKNLVIEFYNFHLSQGEDSPLTPYLLDKDIDANAEIDACTEAEVFYDQFLDTDEQAENARQQFDNIWKPQLTNIRGIAMYLKTFHRGKENMLADWGIRTDDTPQKPRQRTTKLLLGSHITISAVKIGSLLTNHSNVDLHVFKGETTTGAYTILPANQKMGILKGYSTITVVNPSMLETVKFSAVITSGRS